MKGIIAGSSTAALLAGFAHGGSNRVVDDQPHGVPEGLRSVPDVQVHQHHTPLSSRTYPAAPGARQIARAAAHMKKAKSDES